MNANVFYTLCLQPALQVCMSLSTSTQMSAYVLLRTGSQTKVGLAVGAQGVANLATSFPGAWLGDRYGRKFIIRIAVVVGCMGFAALVLALFSGLGPYQEFLCLSGALFTIGIYQGAQNPSVEAVFADSVESGVRSSIYAKKASLRILGNASGPMLAVCAFAFLGNDWKAYELRWCLSMGAALFIVPVCFALSLSEKKTLGAASEALDPTRPIGTMVATAEKTRDDESDAASEVSSPRTPTTPENDLASKVRTRIAFTVVMSDLLLVFGAGFSVRFIPLFLIERGHLSPIAVNAVAACGPLGAAGCAMLAAKISKTMGRVQVTFITKTAGLLCIAGITMTRNTYIIVVLYVIRVCLNNCGTGLTKSILNDYVTKKERARWNSAEAVNVFGWSGSASLGGYIIERHGYNAMFLTTAGIQMFAALYLLTIVHLVQPEKKFSTTSSSARKMRRRSLREPLLQSDDEESKEAFLDDDDDIEDGDASPVGVETASNTSGYSLLDYNQQGKKNSRSTK